MVNIRHRLSLYGGMVNSGSPGCCPFGHSVGDLAGMYDRFVPVWWKGRPGSSRSGKGVAENPKGNGAIGTICRLHPERRTKELRLQLNSVDDMIESINEMEKRGE